MSYTANELNIIIMNEGSQIKKSYSAEKIDVS